MIQLERSIEIQRVWPQIALLANWELLWCHAWAVDWLSDYSDYNVISRIQNITLYSIQFSHSCSCDWLMALKVTEWLTSQTRWSRAVLMYFQAALIYQLAFAPPPRERSKSLIAIEENNSHYVDANPAALSPALSASEQSCSKCKFYSFTYWLTY